MCIYCTTDNYRKIYENHFGPIPKEANGRTYEIHHIDGDHENNDPKNLTAITLQEHYDIHYSQGDYWACFKMKTQRMDKTPEELSQLGKLNVAKQIKNKTHAWLKREDGTSVASDKVVAGTHPLLKREDGTSVASEQVKNGQNKLAKRADGTTLIQERMADPSYVNPFAKRADGTSVAQDNIKNGKNVWAGKDLTGRNNPSFDYTEYTFFNEVTNETVISTQYDMCQQYSLPKANLNAMIKGNRRVCRNWILQRD